MSSGGWQRGPGTRREFLGRIGGLAAASVLGGCVPSAGASSAAASSRALPDGAEVIDEPLTLGDGDALTDRVLVVSERFRNAPDACIVRVTGSRVKVRNVRLVGADSWSSRWNEPDRKKQPSHGTGTLTVGFRVTNVRDVAFEGVEVEGLPQAAILGFGIEGGVFRDLDLHHCYHGLQMLHNAPSRRIHVERVRARDMWGPAPGNWDRGGRITHAQGFPSRSRPGGYIGGDGLALNTLRDSVIADCEFTGEFFGSVKLTNPQRVEVRGVRAGNIMIQGTSTPDWTIHKSPARDVRIHDCLFDKQLTYGPNYAMNCVQISLNVGSVRFESCTLRASGKDGHAIQVVGDSHAQVVGCTIEGFNGRRGPNPAHAVHVLDSSTVNADFEKVNTFVDQQRIRLEQRPRGSRPQG